MYFFEGVTLVTVVPLYFFEGVTLATNAARCKALKMTVCKKTGPEITQGSKWYYTNRTCGFQVDVNPEGSVKVVHKPTSLSRGESVMSWYSVKNTNSFQVQWQGGFPAAAANCGGESACTKRGTSCLCDVTVDTRSVFSAVPTQQQAAASLRIGHADPALFDKGTFTKCTTAACKSASGVDVFLRAQGSIADTSTVFAITVDGVLTFYANKISTVKVGGKFKFRNPPSFHMPWLAPHWSTTRDTTHETNAMFRYLAHHENTAPYIAKRLIRNMVTSNPSPRYVLAVATAFRSGTYTTSSGQFGTRRYGDLGAAVAAMLLDREATSGTVEADPTHGKLREPLVKALQFMRSMELEMRGGIETNFYVTPVTRAPAAHQASSISRCTTRRRCSDSSRRKWSHHCRAADRARGQTEPVQPRHDERLPSVDQERPQCLRFRLGHLRVLGTVQVGTRRNPAKLPRLFEV